MGNGMTPGEYRELFPGRDCPNKRADALKHALDIRKFEIELYWKRATYFWAFIAASFAGYFALESANSSALPEAGYVVSCLGLMFSIAWYFVNRGSKFWQENWEAHVDALEDEQMGPLYKTVLDRKLYRFSDLLGAYAFSPSRLNQILSLYVSFVWAYLAIRSFCNALFVDQGALATFGTMTVLTIGGGLTLYFGGQTSRKSRPIKFRRRCDRFADTHEPKQS